MNRNRKPNRRSAGFTLVEVLVVMAILVLLAGLVAPRILGSKKKANIQTATTQIGSFKSALDRYALDMDTFPTTEQGLQALITEPEADEESAGGGKSRWDGSYLNSDVLPTDPWGNAYQYVYPPTHGKGDSPEIWSFGPDGEDDTEDDIVSWKKVSEDGKFSEDEKSNDSGKSEGK
ncbi:MAG: type II secretion system major pseudopilin GspG [Pirellulales bacterium]|nr:type II secretion system major pseudopilin GspG [Pirellulales bacterium]